MKGRILMFAAAIVQRHHSASAGQVSPLSPSISLSLAVFAVASNERMPAHGGLQVELDALMDKMEVQARALVDRVEWAHGHRCDTAYVGEAACGDTNYHACGTKLPNPVCPAGSEEPECGLQCGTIRDFTVSTVIATGVTTRDQTNLSPLMKESLCWTRLLDDTFVANYAANEADAASGVMPNTVDLQYFGHEATGLWRDFPGQYNSWSTCGTYDPRVRPWYTTAMSRKSTSHLSLLVK